MMKRVISFLLAVVLLVGAVPVGAFATETEAAVSDNGMTIEGSNAVGNLLAQEIQAEMSAEEVYEPGFSVTALEFSGATATVTYDAMEKASLVVAIYSEDGLTLLNNAYTTVYPESTQATVTISGDMPEYFYAAAYLVDTYDMSPLCPDYSTPMYTRDMQDLLDSTVADYDADRVLNLDDSSSTNFLVYAPRLNQIESVGGSNTVESIDDDAMEYVLGNVDGQITALLPGDVVFYEYADEQYLITKVKTLELDGTTATIIGTEVELGEVFSHVKIEGDSDDAVYSYDDSTLGEGLTRTGRSTFSARDAEGKHRFAETYSLFDVGGDGASVSGTLEFAMDVSVKYYAVENVHFLEFRDNASITFDAKFEGSYEKTKPLGKIGARFIGGVIFVGMEPKVILTAEAEAQFTATVTAALGAKLETGKGASSLNETPKVTYDLRVEGSVYLGLDLGPTLEILGGLAVEADMKLAFGYRIEGELTGDITHGEIGGEPEEPEDVLHTCKACIALDGYSQVNFQISARFVKLFKVSSKDYQFDNHLGSWYYSVDHNEFDEGQCPYEEYRVSVEVLDYYGQPVSGALVTAMGEISRSETTNANGIASIYLPLYQYNIRAETDDGLRRTVSTGVLQPRTLTITLPEPPDDPEETVPDEVIPEVTEPAFPGGILGDIESTPVVNAGKPVFTGVFGENNSLKWEFYHDLTLRISGHGEVTDDPWDAYHYGGPDYDYDSGGMFGWNLNYVIDHVILEEGITGFGTVFQNMDWTEKVTLPSTVTRIEDQAFYSMDALQEINIPSGVTYIGEYAFQYCSKLKEITIPGSVQEMGQNTFAYTGLEKVTVEEGITELPDGIFFICQKLKEVELPSTLKTIGWHAFYYSALRNVTIPNGVEEIGYYAFMGTPLTKITIPGSVKNLTGGTFEDCTNLVSVTLNEGLEQIGNDTFKDCTALTSITIPRSVYWIYPQAFSNCTNLREVDFLDGKDPGWLNSRGLYILEGAFHNCTSLTRLDFPARLYKLTANAFAGCTGLQEIVFQYGTPYLDNVSHYPDPNSGIYDYEGAYAEIFPSISAKAYYPWIYCEDAGEDKVFHYGSDSWSKESMKNLGSQITWIPYTVDENGNMVPDESRAYCANPPAEEEIIDQEPANGLLPTEPVETEPVETEPSVTDPTETEPVETEPVETEPMETEPVVTEPVETEPTVTQPTETEPVETVAQTELLETEPQFLTLEEAAELKIPTSASAVTPETIPAAQNEAEVLPPEELLEYLMPPKHDPPPAPPAEVLNQDQVIGKPSYDAIFGGDYSSEERKEYILKTASFSGLVPGEEYLLLAVKSLSGDPMSMSNLIHIDQGRASSGGTLEFDYVEREEFAVSYVMACGASNKNLNDAVITVPTMYASDGEQIVKPKVKYGGKTLKLGTDYTLTGDVAFNTAGEHVCYIRGIYEYTGLVKCTYTVLEKPLPRIMIEGVQGIQSGLTGTLTANFTFDPDPDTVVTWSLAEGDEAYATLTPNGNSVTVKAGQVEETTYITVRAEAPGKAEPATHELTIFPRYTPDIPVEKIEIWQSVWEDGREVWYLVSDESEPTIWVDGETESSIVLNIDTYPMGADQYVYWESSDPEVAVLEQDFGQNNTVTFTGKPGDVTITVYAADGSGVSASATYHAALPMAVEPAVDSDIHLLAGKSTTLKIRNAETKKDIKSGNIQWTMDAGDNDATAYATISKSGKLTAQKVGEQANLTVYGHVYDKGEYVTSVPFTVTVYPAVTQVEIQQGGDVVNGKTISCDPGNQETMTLKVKAYPDDVRNVRVKWSISDQEKQQYAAYEICYDKETGENSLVITPKADIKKVGTVNIKATTDEGSKKSASVKVQFGIFADQVEITAENGKTSLTSKEKLNMTAAVTPNNVTKTGVTWSLSKADKAYASLSAKGNTAVLTAKTVYTRQEVTVIATSKDGQAVGKYNVTILPENILAIRDAAGKNITKTTVSVDLNKPEAERAVTLSAGNFLDEETVAVKWKPAKSSGSALVVPNADGTFTVTMLKKGSLTVMAEAQDGSKRKATVTIKAANLAQAVNITTKDGKNMVMGEDNIPVINLASGKSVNLKATVQNASTTKVNWRVVMLNEKGEEMDAGAYAKISSSGKLSATKDLTSAKEVWVYAQPADGGSAEGKAKVVIRPLAQGVQIYTADQASGQMRTLADSRDAGIFSIARAATTMVWDMHPETNRTLQLAAKVYPFYKGDPSRNALQSVTWTSSKPKVATIDTAGKITFHQAGTTTITATAADGSGKKVSFKLEVVKIMASLKLPEKAFIAGGKKLTLVPEITPVDTSWPHLAWHVSDNTGRNDVTISSKGVLTTPKVTSPREVFVQAMSCDGSDLWTYCDVTIYPATTKVQLWNGEDNVTKLTMAPGETVSLQVTCEPELAAGVYRWTSSNEKYATVDQNGKVIIADTAVSGKKVTITCMADDGTKVKASVTITVEAE